MRTPILMLGLILSTLLVVGCGQSPPAAPPVETTAAPIERTNVGNGGGEIRRKVVLLIERCLREIGESSQARAFLKGKGIDYQQILNNWKPEMVIYNEKGWVPDSTGSDGDERVIGFRKVELNGPAWRNYFQYDVDNRHLAFHLLIRLFQPYGVGPDGPALDNDYLISKDLVTLLPHTDIRFVAVGNPQSPVRDARMVIAQSCEARSVRAVLDMDLQRFDISFEDFSVDSRLYSWLPLRLRPWFAYEAKCHLAVIFPWSIPGEWVQPLAIAHQTQGPDHQVVQLRTRTESQDFFLSEPSLLDPLRVLLPGTSLGRNVKRIDWEINLTQPREAATRSAIEHLRIDFDLRD